MTENNPTIETSNLGSLFIVLLAAILVGGCCFRDYIDANRDTELQQLRMAVQIYSAQCN